MNKHIAKTKHCEQRMRQRGRRNIDIRIIQKYGEVHRGGLLMISERKTKNIIQRFKNWIKTHKSSSFKRREAKIRKIIHLLEKLKNWLIITNHEETVITIYRADKYRQRKFMRGNCRQYIQD